MPIESASVKATNDVSERPKPNFGPGFTTEKKKKKNSSILDLHLERLEAIHLEFVSSAASLGFLRARLFGEQPTDSQKPIHEKTENQGVLLAISEILTAIEEEHKNLNSEILQLRQL